VLKKENLVKFSPPTTTNSVRMLAHSKSTMHVLCMLMCLSLDHMNLQRGGFQSFKLFCASDLQCLAASHWALPHISSFLSFHWPQDVID